MELIKVINNDDGKQVVSARELHNGLEINTRFNDWIKNMIVYGFEDGIDYTKILVQCIRGQNQYDYAISIDMAKEISMIQRSELGRKYRQYFIECERVARTKVPVLSDYDMAILGVMKSENDIERVGALKHFQNVIEKPLLETIETQAPKVDRFDKLMNTEFTFTPTQMAKAFGLSSAQRLNKIMNDNGICYKKGKGWYPYENVNKEWYKVVVNEYGSQLRFTGKGVVEISKIIELEFNEDLLQEEQ